jgi:small-conductance mechanosensitive channel
MNLPNFDPAILEKIFSSLLALMAVLLARVVADRAVVRRVRNAKLRRRWRASIRTAAALVLLMALIAVWAEALAEVAFSLVAVAVATVIATKDLIECMMGSLLRMTADSYTVGDRVAILTYRGDVVEYNVLTTTLREVEAARGSNRYTGQTVTLPNSLLLRHPVVNESAHGPYVLHTFQVPLSTQADWRAAERVLLDAAVGATRDFIEDARAAWRQASAFDGPESPVDPAVTVQIDSTDHLTLTARLFVPIGRQEELEQTIIREFLSHIELPAPLAPAPRRG